MRSATVLAALLFFSPLVAFAQELPQPTTDDLWDISQGTVVTSNSPLYPGFHAENAFGDTNGPLGSGNLIFADHQPVETVHSIEWRTTQPITLEKFRLFAVHRTSRPLNSGCTFPDARVRGFKYFRLYAKTENGDWQQVYELDPIVNGHYKIANEEYQGVLEYDRPTGREPFLHEGVVAPIYAQEFKAEFIQGGDPTDGTQCSLWRNETGPRVVELDGFGSTEPPQPEAPEPIVIVPGMIVPLNLKVTFGDATEGGTWDFAPTTRELYQGLLDRLAAKGFVENENLFIAHYDWRKSISFSADTYLKPVIDQAKAATGNDKVNIVAHSMGGLVSRAYVQSAGYEDDVDQIITLGTPHLGAADAYLAWEGGQLPERWDPGLKVYIRLVESALRVSHAQVLPRPLSFREFFPSLRDLLPPQQFVDRLNVPLSIADMAAENPFMQFLVNTADRLADHGVRVATIAGDSLPTLGHIAVSSERSLVDVALERWRDGHPENEHPSPDSTAGDQTVLLSSAHFGSHNTTLSNVKHDQLPEAAQDTVLAALGLDTADRLITYNEPDTIVGTVVLSPVVPSITGPDGNTITCDTSKQINNTYCVVDEADLNSPKLVVVADPEPGTYKLTLTGIASGPYHAVTCYADNDDDVCTQQTGTTTAEQVDSTTFSLDGHSFAPPVVNTVNAMCQFKETIQELKADHLTPPAYNLQGLGTALCNHAQQWQRAVDERGNEHQQTKKQNDKMMETFRHFSSEFFVHAENGYLDATAIQQLQSLFNANDL